MGGGLKSLRGLTKTLAALSRNGLPLGGEIRAFRG